jgi:hypothetical protein
MAAISVADYISGALNELNVLLPGRSPTARDGVWCLSILNELRDFWNAKRETVWAQVFSTFTLIPGTQPHTIGPTGANFTLAVRPVSLDGASLLITNVTPAVKNPINIRDYQWWLANSTANQNYANTITSSIVTDIYYQPDWPNGKLFMFPAPTTAYDIVLVSRTLYAQVTENDTIDLPPGGQRAFRLTLVEALCSSFGRAVPPQVEKLAREARAQFFGNNIMVPTLVTRDGGMPGGQHHRPDFFWPTGQIK